MVPPQPRLPVRRPFRAGRAVGLTAAVAALAALLVLALGPVLPAPLKEQVNWLRGYPAWRRRAALGPEAPPFNGLAASQVGYGPSMVKQFSSPRRFASFQVVRPTASPSSTAASWSSPSRTARPSAPRSSARSTRAQIPVHGLALREPSLDDVFLSLTGHKTEAETEEERRARPKRRSPPGGHRHVTDGKDAA